MALYDIKPGVTWNPSAEIARAQGVVSSILTSLGIPFVVTSGTEGQHSAGSLHYSGNAMDVRRWDLDRIGMTATAVSQIRGALGPNFDVVLESDHIHVEFDPKGGTIAAAIGINADTGQTGIFSGLSTPMIIALVAGAFFLLKR